MSNISRRQFLKGAGVATLAVAAAGMLAGCSKEDIPQVPETPETTRPVSVIFMVDNGNGKTSVVGETAAIKVLKTAKSVKVADIDKKLLPEGYELENEKAEVEIRKDATKGEYIIVFVKWVKTTATKTIEIGLFEQPHNFMKTTAEIEEDATGVYLNQIKLPAGYIFDPMYDRYMLYPLTTVLADGFNFVVRKSA